ncbi:TRZ/ATZ family hydrolase [Granulosicoccaceae sp. 1_MG-2023]|nr:TRZ/ATZ family hydrolase [Granulosicoccaceae sp. 1_MG-2023]
MNKADLILSPRWLVTVDDDNRVLDDHSLVIRDGKIAAILPRNEALAAWQGEHRDLPDHILAPGLINAHTHLAMNLLRGYADDLPLMDWLNNHIWPAEARWVSEEFVADGTQLAIAESLLGGTTTVNDMYFFPDVAANMAAASGIRATVGLMIIDFPTSWGSGPDEYFSKAIALHDALRDDPLVRTALAPHAPYTVSRGPLERVSTLASELDIPVHMHIHETAAEVDDFVAAHGVRPLQRLHETGLLTPSLMAVHMTQLTDEEIAGLAHFNVSVVHCPESNMKLASGGCPVAALLKAGVNVALGTDGAASNNDLDMFGEMRSAALLGKHLSGNPAEPDAFSILRMATINGARALGLGAVTGSLEVGKAADLMAVSVAPLSMQPVYEPVSHLVYSASRECVEHVWVAGRQLVDQRRLTTLDEADLGRRARQWLNRITSTPVESA